MVGGRQSGHIIARRLSRQAWRSHQYRGAQQLSRATMLRGTTGHDCTGCLATAKGDGYHFNMVNCVTLPRQYFPGFWFREDRYTVCGNGTKSLGTFIGQPEYSVVALTKSAWL